MKLSQIVQEARYVQKTEGVQDAARQFDELARAQHGAAGEAEVLARQQAATEKAITRVGSKLDAYTRQHDPLTKALRDVERGEALIAAARSRGIDITSAHTSAVEKARERYTKLSEVLNDNGKAVGLARHEWVNLGRQLQDAGTMAAMGASPMQILTSQGAQIADVFASSRGGAAAALKEFGVSALRLATNPLTLIAAGMGTAAYATIEWQRSIDKLTVSLNGLGRASGLTIEGASLVAERAARAAGISVSSARGLAATYLGAGVPGASLGGGVGLTRDFSRRFGLSQDDAASTLAGALADPARGAEELARRYGLLSYAQREQIIQIANMGDRAGASAKLVGDLRESMKRLEDPTWTIGRAFEDLKTKLSDFLSAIGRGIGGGEVENEFERQRRFQQAQQNLAAGRLNEALERQVGLDKLANDAAFAAREITAQTYAQREAVAMEKARVQTLRDTKYETMATMAAEAERLRLMAEAQRKVDDYVRTGAREMAISGATTPFERARMQIIQEGQDLLRQIPATIPTTRRMRIPAAANDPGPGIGTGTQALIAEAERRGLEPTEATFEKLIAEGVGSGRFRGRLVNLNEGFARSTVDVPNVNAGRMRRQVIASTQERLNALGANQEREFTSRVNRDIEAQNSLLTANTEAFAKSTYEVERAKKAAELYNQAKQQGLPLTASLTKEIESQAARYGELARRQEEAQRSQQRFVENLDFIRSSARDALGGLASDLARGKRAGDALADTLSRIADRLIGLAADRAIEGLFGRTGTANGFGFLGGILGSVFGFSQGGVVGVHGSPMRVPVGAFVGARQYAAGGAVGAGARPIIAHDGELILNQAMQRNVAASMRIARDARNDNRGAASGAMAPKTEVYVYGAPSGTQVRESENNRGGRRVEVVIDEQIANSVTSSRGLGALESSTRTRRILGVR